MAFKKIIAAIGKPQHGLGIDTAYDDSGGYVVPVGDTLLTLRLRDRGMGGDDVPLSVSIVHLIEGEGVGFRLPLAHVLPGGITVDSVASTIKTGSGVVIEALDVLTTYTDVVGRIRITDDPTISNIGALQVTLNNGDVWEVNVPVWAAASTGVGVCPL